MVMGGYIAHHQVYTIFQGLPRQVPPDHMCHPWPISRVGSRAQNFALKSQISLLNKYLFSVAAGYGAWDLLNKKKRRKIEILWPRIDCKKNADFSFVSFSAELHYTNCVPDFCWKKFSAELSIQTYGSAELIFWFFVVDFCWFNAFP